MIDLAGTVKSYLLPEGISLYKMDGWCLFEVLSNKGKRTDRIAFYLYKYPYKHGIQVLPGVSEKKLKQKIEQAIQLLKDIP